MASSANVSPVHILCLVHGMWGWPAHVARLAEVMQESYGARSEIELNVLIAETNRDAHTYDGVDWGAERVVQEIKGRVASLEADKTKKVTRFSIIGYSLGGLLARYTVGILHSQSFFDQVTPVNFATIATPHIGLLRYETFFSKLAFNLGPTFLSRTGKHFYATDGEWGDGKTPLLEAMSQPGGVFYTALTKFSQVTFLANAVNDLTVPYITAAAEPFDPFVAYPRKGVVIELDDKYAPVIKSYAPSTETIPPPPPKPVFLSVAWWKHQRSLPSKLPPPLQFRAPYNLLAWVAIPVLAPLLLTLIISNFVYNASKSRRRIKLLESSGTGSRSALMDLVRTIEKETESTMVEMMDDGPEDGDAHPDAGPSNVTTPSRATTPVFTPTASSAPIKPSKSSKLITYTALSDTHSPYYRIGGDDADVVQNQPLLSDAQKRMIANLNTLPNLGKVFVFLDGIRNSHAAVVSRDLKQFAFHARGEGGLRYLADHFAL